MAPHLTSPTRSRRLHPTAVCTSITRASPLEYFFFAVFLFLLDANFSESAIKSGGSGGIELAGLERAGGETIEMTLQPKFDAGVEPIESTREVENEEKWRRIPQPGERRNDSSIVILTTQNFTDAAASDLLFVDFYSKGASP